MLNIFSYVYVFFGEMNVQYSAHFLIELLVFGVQLYECL